MLGMTNSCNYPPPWSALCTAPTNPNIATPPPPPVNLWTVAPANQTQADAVVQAIANQQLVNQQAIDASQVGYVSDWVPSFLVPSPKYDAAGNLIPSSSMWGTALLVITGVLAATVIFGGRRR